jgi:hypothetical protein
MEVYYTAHYNWQWVVDAAVDQLRGRFGNILVSFEDRKNFKHLPSTALDETAKPKYSLFRLDLIDKSASIRLYKDKIRVHSEGFAYLDPKDSLYRIISQTSPESLTSMPYTVLIQWDASDAEIEQISWTFLEKFNKKAMLKAPMGSGGFGLYYVYHPRDIIPIVQNHRRRAEIDPSFLQNLLASYGEYGPCWSLQEVIHSYLLPTPITNSDMILKDGNIRRTQVRMYAIVCDNVFCIYHEGIEVRMPAWDIDIDNILEEEALYFGGDLDVQSTSPPNKRRPWSEEVEEECCGVGNGRPYNEQRNKQRTTRYMLEELGDMNNARHAIVNCMIQVCQALRTHIMHQHTKTQNPNEVSMGIMGVDLLVSQPDIAHDNNWRVVVVEVNNNPAMPGSNKSMSSLYRQHLIDMMSAFFALGIYHSMSEIEGNTPTGSSPCAVNPLLDSTMVRLLEKFMII